MNIEEMLRLLGQVPEKTYRQRLDEMFPAMHEEIADNAIETMQVVSDQSKSNDEIADFIDQNPLSVVNALYGMLNAIEVISEGKIGSRSKGSAPVNLLAAFCTWLWLNPAVVTEFKGSALYKQLIASSRDGFEWDD